MKYALTLMVTIGFLTSCNWKAAHIIRNEMTKKELQYKDSSITLKRDGGTDFIASGSEPINWTLEMDFDKNYILKTANGCTISCAPVSGIKTENPAGELFNAKGVHEAMDISIQKSACSEDEKHQITTIMHNDTLFKGCGQYLFNQQLHNKWILYQIDNAPISAMDYPEGLPYLTIDLAKKTMNGSDGCNRIKSDIKIYGDRIQFSMIRAVTRKICIHVNKKKFKLHLLSNQLVEYRFRNGDLVLYLIDDSRLVFKAAY